MLWLAGCGSAPPAPISTGAATYRVKAGDTLYRIAKTHGRSVAELARWNGLADPTDIRVGQVLRVAPPTGSRPAGVKPTPRPGAPANPTPMPRPAASIRLVMPAQGELAGSFDGQRSKGIQIAGKRGSAIVAAAAGRVVYAGEGIRSYGKLLIIKHDNDYLTAYAHNANLLVGEDAVVRQGQQIATMGDTGASRVQLHFELRYQGRAIDPRPYLP